jgi:hypothetical protein
MKVCFTVPTDVPRCCQQYMHCWADLAGMYWMLQEVGRRTYITAADWVIMTSMLHEQSSNSTRRHYRTIVEASPSDPRRGLQANSLFLQLHTGSLN